MQSNKLSNDIPPSEKYKTKELEPNDFIVEKENGETAPVTVLPTSEMPHTTIFGYKDPLEGSPARNMTNSLLKGDLLGSFIEQVDGEFIKKIDGGEQAEDASSKKPAEFKTPKNFKISSKDIQNNEQQSSSNKLNIKP